MYQSQDHWMKHNVRVMVCLSLRIPSSGSHFQPSHSKAALNEPWPPWHQGLVPSEKDLREGAWAAWARLKATPCSQPQNHPLLLVYSFVLNHFLFWNNFRLTIGCKSIREISCVLFTKLPPMTSRIIRARY